MLINKLMGYASFFLNTLGVAKQNGSFLWIIQINLNICL